MHVKGLPGGRAWLTSRKAWGRRRRGRTGSDRAGPLLAQGHVIAAAEVA